MKRKKFRPFLVALFTVKRSRRSHDWVGQMTGSPPTSDDAPKLYRLPKIHKKDTPFRPIVPSSMLRPLAGNTTNN